MDDRKIAFIICVNDELYFQECLYYINKLQIPFGHTVEVFAVREAKTICQAYNQAMQQSDAKYKVYMHQDVFVMNHSFLNIVTAFFNKHEKAGLLGVLGCSVLPIHNRFYKSWDVGNVLGYSETKFFHNELNKNGSHVQAIDGMLMVTQYDIPWREECISGWDFYDFSQSLEFQKKGYEIWIPEQRDPWCIHDCGILNFSRYDENRKEFLREYEKFFAIENPDVMVYNTEKKKYRSLMMELKENLKQMMFSDEKKEAKQIVSQYYDERYIDTEWAIIKNLLDNDEKEPKFLLDCNCWVQAYQKYLMRKFKAWREIYIV